MKTITLTSIAIVLAIAALPSWTTATTNILLVGEPPRFPSEQQSDIFTFETDVNGDPRDLIIPCNITGNTSGVSYTWFRGSNELPSEMVDEEGNLVVVNITEGEYASRRGVEYNCVASKVIGKNSYTASVRSRTITVFYAFFNGFERTETQNVNIPVALDSDVAMECDVRDAKPQPQIQWRQNGVVLSESTAQNEVRFLDDGRFLYLRELDNTQLQSTYSCSVINALLGQEMPAPTTYRLSDNLTQNELVDYKQIGELTAFVGDRNVEFAYVGGASTSSSPGRNGTSNVLSANGTDVPNVLGNIATILEINQVGRIALEAEVRFPGPSGFDIRTGHLDVFRKPRITDAPSDNRTLVVGQENLMYTCEFEGSPPPDIEWFFNGQPISADSGVSTVSNTLTIASPQVSNSGIYQCIVSSDYGDDQHAWLLEIRQPTSTQVQPYNFTELGATNDRDVGALIVSANGSTVMFSVDVVSDPCPTIEWRFNGTQLGLSNSTFTYNDPCTAPGALSPNWTFTLEVELTADTSGPYTANFTNIAGTTQLPRAYLTIPEPVAIADLKLESEACLKEDRNVSMRCVISGFPRPSITFQVNGSDITPGNGIYEGFVVQEFYDQIAILNVNMSAGGRYTCIADNERSTKDFNFCTTPAISDTQVTDNPSIGSDFSISCTASGIPMPTIGWRFKGETLEDGVNLRVVTTGSGDTSRVEVQSATTDNNGLYECIVSNDAGSDSEEFFIELRENPTLPLSLGAIIGIAAGGVGAILLITFVILLLVCVYSCAKKTTSGNYSANPAYMGQDYHDGRGNVDKDSDEEDGQPEAFNPQYESLPALRPSQPPSYKPTPSYPMQVDDMEMMKVPLPDSDSYLGGGYMMQDNGPAPYNRPAVDDFLSEDAQFV